MQTYTINQVEEAVNDTGYKYIALYTSSGKQLIPYNNTKPTVQERLEEIRKRLKSPSIKDGLYIVRAKNHQSRDGVYDEFPIQKGTGKIETLKENTAPKKESNNPEITTYKEVLKLEKRITELTYENQALEKEIDDLEEEIEDLKTQLEELKENPPALAEGQSKDFLDRAGSWLQDIITTASPLIDKHFELKQLALNNETAKIMLAQGRQLPIPQKQQQPQQKAPDPSQQFVVKKIQEFITQFQDDETKYEALATIFNESESLDNFYERMKAHDIKIFNALIKFINSKK